MLRLLDDVPVVAGIDKIEGAWLRMKVIISPSGSSLVASLETSARKGTEGQQVAVCALQAVNLKPKGKSPTAE